MNSIIKILKNKLLLAVIVVIPVLSSVVYTEIYSVEVVEDLPVIVSDNDNTELSRELVRMFDNSPTIKIIDRAVSENEIKDALVNEKAYAGLVIPHNFGSGIKSGKKQTVTIFKASKNIIVSNLLLKEAATVTGIFSSEIFAGKLIKSGMNKTRATFFANPIEISTQSLFNPNYSYLNYLVPGLILFTLQLSAIISGALLLSYSKGLREIKSNFFAGLFWNVVVSLLIIFVLMPLLHLTPVKNPGSVALLIIFATTVTYTLGSGISFVTKGGMAAIEAVVFYTTPAFVFSGLTFPTWGMPLLHQYYSKIIPFTYLLESYIKLGKMGTSLSGAINELIALGVFGIISAAVIMIGLKINQGKIG